MREKLQKLMSTEQLTSSRFAELLGIQPSGVSHLLGGRNKPSFDLVQKILRRFPHINPDWLILDSEQMYRTDADNLSASTNSAENASPEMAVNGENISAAQNIAFSESSQTSARGVEQMMARAATTHKNVKRVIVLFDDHTFESFEMSR
ncbi:MAG: helix-turn-helix transcriptional regulator [Alistipes sp.]|nr:helix-turn-helix transcriptional regulator [Alistipes sp.]